MWQVTIPLFAVGFLAAADNNIPEPWGFILNYGILGVVLILILSGRFMVTRRELDVEKELRLKAEEALQESQTRERLLYQEVKGDVVPTLSAVAKQVTEASIPKQVTTAELAQKVSELTRALRGHIDD